MVGFGVSGAIPIKIVSAIDPARAVVLADDHDVALIAVGQFDGVVGATDGELPADIRLGFDVAYTFSCRQVVQRAAAAASKVGVVVEDAGAIDNARLAISVFVFFNPLLGLALPHLRGEFGHCFFHSFFIGLRTEVRTVNTTARVGHRCVDALATVTKDAGKARREPREVSTNQLILVSGIKELHPFTGECQRNLRHADTLRG